MSPSDTEETFILFRGKKNGSSLTSSYLWQIIPAKDSQIEAQGSKAFESPGAQ